MEIIYQKINCGICAIEKRYLKTGQIKLILNLKNLTDSDVFNASRASERAREIGTVDYKILICYFVAKK